MISKVIHIIVMISSVSYVAAQEFLFNPDFEITVGCDAPDENLNNLEGWYSINATPDYFNVDCPWDPSGAVFWSNQDTARSGLGFIGLSSRFNANNTFTSEAIGASLIEPLVADEIYNFEISFRSQGFYQGFPDSLLDCPLRPYKHIDIYLSEDSIEVIDDFSTGRPSLSGNLVAVLDNEEITAHKTGDWMTVSTCLTAKGGERFIAIAMPFGDFGELPPCTTVDNNATFYTFYFDLDQLSLQRLDLDLSNSITICQRQELDLSQIGLPEYDDIIVRWDDGGEGVVRSGIEEGNYDLEIMLPCSTFTQSLEVITDPCDNSIYIPNVFVPGAASGNSIWQIETSNSFRASIVNIQVYDKWGGVVFQANDFADGWDGTSVGKDITAGTYVYRVEFTSSESSEIRTGTLTLIR